MIKEVSEVEDSAILEDHPVILAAFVILIRRGRPMGRPNIRKLWNHAFGHIKHLPIQNCVCREQGDFQAPGEGLLKLS